MLTKDEVCASLLHEYRNIRQLIGKLPAGSEDDRISPTQRSTIELLQYLLMLGPGVLHAANDGGFKWFEENGPRCQSVTFKEAPEYVDGAMAEMEHLFSLWSEEEFTTREVTVPGMGTWTLQGWVLNTLCKFLPAYKLQLFHHAKASGNTDLNTWDAWFDDGQADRPAG